MRPLGFTSLPATQGDAARPYAVARRGDAAVVAVGQVGAEAPAARRLGAEAAAARRLGAEAPATRRLGAEAAAARQFGAEAPAARQPGAPAAMAVVGSVPPGRPLGAQGGAICRDLHAGQAAVPRSRRLRGGDPGRRPVPAPPAGP